MKKVLLLTLLAFTPHSWGALLTYQLVGSTNPGFFNFTIDGVKNQMLLCDEFLPNVTSETYNSVVVTLADVAANNANAQLTLLCQMNNAKAQFTTLCQSGISDTTALTFYRYVAYLDALAYAAPAATRAAVAANVVLANRWMIDGLKDGKTANFLIGGTAAGTGPLTNGAQDLLTQVQSLAVGFAVDPNFRIFTSPFAANGSRLTQEQTGVVGGAVPEPASALYFGLGLIAIGLVRKSKTA